MYFPTYKYHKTHGARLFANLPELAAAIKESPGWYENPDDFANPDLAITPDGIIPESVKSGPGKAVYKRGDLMRENKGTLIDILFNTFGKKLDQLATKDNYADAILEAQKARADAANPETPAEG